jgi:hypothetical protein
LKIYPPTRTSSSVIKIPFKNLHGCRRKPAEG